MIPTIQTEIELLQNTKDELRTAIMEKGVSVSSNDLFSTYPTRISQISMTPGDKDDLFKSLIDRSITSLVVPDGTEILRPHVFSGCSNITSLTLPNSLKIIYNGALTGLHGVTTLVIPDSVKRIESSSSYPVTTTNLTSLTLGSGLEYIGNNAFYNRTNLTSITCLAETPPTLNTNMNAFDNTNNCPIYVPENSVDAYKAAWSKYASRIQAIPEVEFFRRITSLDDVTSGKYLIVDTDNNIALNASLIASTTSTSNGINTFGNYIDVGITGDTIEATATTLNAAVDYDGRYLTWTDEMYGTVYHLTQNGTNAVKFKPYATSSMYEITPFDDYECRTFQSPTKAIGLFTGTTSSSKTIRWQDKNTTASLENMALFKLD